MWPRSKPLSSHVSCDTAAEASMEFNSFPDGVLNTDTHLLFPDCSFFHLPPSLVEISFSNASANLIRCRVSSCFQLSDDSVHPPRYLPLWYDSMSLVVMLFWSCPVLAQKLLPT